MIDEKTKQKIIRELGKNGNVYVACHRLGIHPSTLYRWKNKDKQFKKIVNTAIQIGRMNNADIAEHSLMIEVKKGNMTAIGMCLRHNSPRYKPKVRKVVIEHSSHGHDTAILNEEDRRKIDEQACELKKLIEEVSMNGSGKN